MPHEAVLVSQIAGNRAVLKVDSLNGSAAKSVIPFGFHCENALLVRSIVDRLDRQQLIKVLIAKKALFIGGSGWSPAELVEHYRELGLIDGTYLRIVWRSPDEFLITES